VETTKKAKRVRHPSWWTPEIEAGWLQEQERVMASYEKDKPGKHLLRWLSRRAVGFGHGARLAHPHLHSWKDAERELQTDWAVETSRPEGTWDLVTAAVRYGWDSALLMETEPLAAGSR
jgi:hypothetical protein